MHVFQIERGHVLDLPAQMIGAEFDGLDGMEFCARIREVAARGKGELQSLEDEGNGRLDTPDLSSSM